MAALWRYRASAAVLAAIALAACGGGGGGGGGGLPGAPVSPPAPPPPPPPSGPALVRPPLPPPSAPGSFPSTASSEYNANWGVAGTNAIEAWRFSTDGSGVLVAVIDDGIESTHPEINDNIVGAIDIVAGRNAPFIATNTHGSELTAIIAGEFNGASTIGQAYNADILSVRADNGAGGFQSADLANALDYARAQGAKVVNFSLGSTSPSSAIFQAAIQRATQAGMIIVVSAGNDGPFATEVNYPGFLATDPATSNNLIVTVGGMNPDGTFNDRSNQAGVAASYYLTAPGWEIIVPDFAAPGSHLPVGFQACGADGAPGVAAGFCRVQGTSYAAPHVTGAVALLLDAFPTMTPQDIVRLLLLSTDDIGLPGVDAQTGRGRLNLAKAFAPVGPTSAPLATGASIALGAPVGDVGPAYGDAVGLADWRAAAFDSFGRAFAMDLSRGWRMQAPARSFAAPALWRTHHDVGGATTLSFANTPLVGLPEGLAHADLRSEQPALAMQTRLSEDTTLGFATRTAVLAPLTRAEAAGHLGFVGGGEGVRLTRTLGPGVQLTAATQSDEAGAARASLARIETRGARWSLAASLGALSEEGALLGLSWADTIGARAEGETRFLGIAGAWGLADGVTLSGEAEFGRGALSGWMRTSTPVETSAYAAALSFDLSPGALVTLSARQPLRVDGGAFMVSLPTADSRGRASLAFSDRTIALAPSGRALELGVALDLWRADAFSVRASLTHADEPGHIANAPDETAAQLGARVQF